MNTNKIKVRFVESNNHIKVKFGVVHNVNGPSTPEGYIKPSGTLDISTNGSHDVTKFESVDVNVPIPDGYIKPSGTKEIAENGTHDVTQYASVKVNVPSKTPNIQPLEITENGTHTAPEGVDGYSPITVNVASGLTPVATSLIRKGVGHIDTGIDGANSNLTIETRYEFISMPSGYWYLIRAYKDESTNSTRILYNKTNNVYCCLNSIPNQSLSRVENRYAGVVYTDILKPENSTTFSYTQNGEKTSKARTSGSRLVGENLLLFMPSSTADSVSIKVYYLKIFDGETIVRDFIPFVTSDGECGLYDKVTNQFYGNAGSGAFEVETINFVEA